MCSSVFWCVLVCSGVFWCVLVMQFTEVVSDPNGLVCVMKCSVVKSSEGGSAIVYLCVHSSTSYATAVQCCEVQC